MALQVAAELRDQFTDGVCFVTSGADQRSGLVVATIAQTLEIKEIGSQPLLERLKNYLREKQLLLCSTTSSRWWPRRLPSPTYWRQRRSSRCWSPAGRCCISRASRSSRCRRSACPIGGIFHPSRAGAVRRGGALRRAGAGGQARLPAHPRERRSRGRDLPPAGRAAAGDRAGGGARTSSAAGAAGAAGAAAETADRRRARSTARQQTLRNTIDWSYDLLDDAEQTLFTRLGVFVGGCTLEAAERVWGAAI